MTKFRIEKNTSALGNPVWRIMYEGDVLVIAASDLPALYSCVGAAMAESIATNCKCPDHFSNMRSEPICGSYTNDRGADDYCQTVLPDGSCCSHERACHQPLEPARGNEQ